MSSAEHSSGDAIPLTEALARDFSFEFFAWVVTALVSAMLGFMALGGRFADVYMFLAGSEEVSGDVVIVSVGPESLYIWNPEEPAPELTPRAMLAELVEVLDAHGAEVIALDVLLEGRQAGDDALALAAQSHGAVIGGAQYVEVPGFDEDFVGGISSDLADPHREVDPSGVQSAHVNLFKEEPHLFSDSMVVRGVHPVVRTAWRAPLTEDWRERANFFGTKTSVSLGFAGAWLYRERQENPGASLEDLIEHLNEACPDSLSTCHETALSRLPDLGADLSEPFILNYLGSEESNQFDVIQARDLLTLAALAPPQIVDAKLSARLDDKLVVLGRTDRLAIDRHTTPYAFPSFSREDMAGVLVQAQIMESVLSGRKIRSMGWWSLLLTVLAAAGAGTLYRYLGAGRQLLVWSLCSLGSLGVGCLLFTAFNGLVLELGGPITVSLLTLATCHLVAYGREERTAEVTLEATAASEDAADLPTPEEAAEESQEAVTEADSPEEPADEPPSEDAANEPLPEESESAPQVEMAEEESLVEAPVEPQPEEGESVLQAEVTEDSPCRDAPGAPPLEADDALPVEVTEEARQEEAPNKARPQDEAERTPPDDESVGTQGEPPSRRKS